MPRVKPRNSESLVKHRIIAAVSLALFTLAALAPAVMAGGKVFGGV